MSVEELPARQLLSRLNEINATLRRATQFSNQVSLRSWTLLRGFTSPENISLARMETIALNKQAEEQLAYSEWLLRRSYELSNRIALTRAADGVTPSGPAKSQRSD